MGLFDSAAERERKRILKEEEKERKRKEFERIMASNPEVSSKPQSTYDRNKAQSTYNKKDDDVVRCPKCGSTSITANKKGFSLVKGAAGVLTFGAYGVVTAGIGKNKIIITCLKCGKQFKPGK